MTRFCLFFFQAVAWITAAHRFTPDIFGDDNGKEMPPSPIPIPIPIDMENLAGRETVVPILTFLAIFNPS